MFIGVVLFFHEFGHAIACKKLGANPGEIGFGFYMLSPVMFADVSDIWKLDKKDRIKVNLAGIYMEVLIAFFLTIFYLILLDSNILILISIIMIRVLGNLNPFLRYDGYWILSDYIDVPNLRKVSLQNLKQLFSYVLLKSQYKFSLKGILLAVYALLSISFVFVLLIYILLNDPYSILTFPSDLYHNLKNLISNHRTFEFSKFILPILFYFIVIKTVIQFLRKKVFKKSL